MRSDGEESRAPVAAAGSSSSPSSVYDSNERVSTPKIPGERLWSPLGGVAGFGDGKDGDVHLRELSGIRVQRDINVSQSKGADHVV